MSAIETENAYIKHVQMPTSMDIVPQCGSGSSDGDKIMHTILTTGLHFPRPETTNAGGMLGATINMMRTEIIALKSSAQLKDDIIQSYKKNFDTLTSKHAEATAETGAMREEINLLREENENLRKQLEDVVASRENLMGEKEGEHMHLKDLLEKQNASLTEKIGDLERECEKLSEEKKVAQQEAARLARERDYLDQAGAKLAGENRKLVQLYEGACRENSDFEKKIADLAKAQARLERENAELAAANVGLETAKANLETENAELRKRESDSETRDALKDAELRLQKDDAEAARAAMEAELEGYRKLASELAPVQEENARIRQDLVALDETIAVLGKERAESLREIATLRGYLEKTRVVAAVMDFMSDINHGGTQMTREDLNRHFATIENVMFKNGADEPMSGSPDIDTDSAAHQNVT